jgi:ferric-dicitrate binding protein FerR (iron transport regulator)
MNDEHLHIDDLEQKTHELFSGGKISWSKTKEEIWNNLKDEMEIIPEGKKTTLGKKILMYAAAAIVLALAGISGLIFFYSKTFETSPGEHRLVSLPGGSSVDLNAASTFRYYPFKWHFKRKGYLEGEGFFTVIKGKKFEVVSANGTTCVLGTSFNIYSRDEKYEVTCLTGRVKVISNSSGSVLLNPNSHVEISGGRLILNEKYKADRALAWRQNQFFFSGTPLKEVFEEVERQYGITIKIEPKLSNRNFAGNFRKKYSVEEVLDVICKTMQLSYIKSSENVYLIREKS